MLPKGVGPSRLLLLLLLLPWLLGSLNSQAEAAQSSEEGTFKARQNVWSVGLQSRMIRWGDDPNTRLYLQANSLDISRVWIRDHWWSSIDISLILGPSSERLPDSPPIDYQGSGGAFRLAYPLFSDGLRQATGDWGIFFGGETMEMNGRSFRREVLSLGAVSEAWVVRSRWLALIPGLFYSNLKPARPKGNRPEWLMTRLEGYTIQLGLVVPIKAEMEVTSTINEIPQRRSASIRGYAGLLSFSAWLGI